jgi:hypothetical protein
VAVTKAARSAGVSWVTVTPKAETLSSDGRLQTRPCAITTSCLPASMAACRTMARSASRSRTSRCLFVHDKISGSLT